MSQRHIKNIVFTALFMALALLVSKTIKFKKIAIAVLSGYLIYSFLMLDVVTAFGFAGILSISLYAFCLLVVVFVPTRKVNL